MKAVRGSPGQSRKKKQKIGTDDVLSIDYPPLWAAPLRSRAQGGSEMKRRTRILFVSLLVATLGAFAWFVLRNSEPVYQGKSLTFWLRQEVDNRGDDPEAGTAIRAMGADAIPTLLQMLRTKDTGVRGGLMNLSEKFDWFPIRLSKAEDLQDMAAFGFMALGPSARPAVKDLLRCLRDSDPRTRSYAAFCLGRIGPGTPEVRYLLWSVISRVP